MAIAMIVGFWESLVNCSNSDAHCEPGLWYMLTAVECLIVFLLGYYSLDIHILSYLPCLQGCIVGL